MDLCDTTNILFSKIKVLDPENASKIMGYILIQDLADMDLLRLAFGPETLLQSLVFKAKAHLGLSSSTFSTHLNPISRPNSSNNSQNPLPPLSPSIIPRNGFLEFSKKVPSWSPASSPKSSPFLSYENIRSGSLLVTSKTGDSGMRTLLVIEGVFQKVMHVSEQLKKPADLVVLWVVTSLVFILLEAFVRTVIIASFRMALVV
ncbi:hypothetical protein GOBAR_DD20608 [Gossypium barbadense]|nr:hypothetical protein GOBAR_DD20608 [Gossypium barbadense]